MKVPLLDLKPQMQGLETSINDTMSRVANSTQYILGPEVEKLELHMADYLGVKNCIGVSSGTDALLMTLMALNVSNDDIVITSPYSFIATAGVIARTGARPVFVDIDASTFNMDPVRLEEWFIENPKLIKKVKAVLPVHLFGQCAELGPILNCAKKYNIPVIEDAAQAIGASYPTEKGYMKAGTMGLAGCFSFYPTKNLGCFGEGGLISTNDQVFADKLRLLRVHGSKERYYHSVLGGNFRLDAIQAAVLSLKLPYLEEWNAIRRKNAESYNMNLSSEKIILPKAEFGANNHTYNQFVIKIQDKRNQLREYLNNHQIGNDIYYPVPIHLQECFKYLGYKEGDLPVSEQSAKCSLAIPIYPGLSKEQLKYVVNKINEFVN